MMGDDPELELARTIEKAIEGMSPLEAVLFLSRCFREATGEEWQIVAHQDGEVFVLLKA